MRFDILGRLEVSASGVPLDLGPPKQRAVLALLLIHANHVVSLDRFLDDLWGDEAPPRATGTLQAYISNLRRVLEPGRAAGTPPVRLLTRAPGYVLRVEPDDLDAACFERLAGEGHTALADGRYQDARDTLGAALALWRGAALADAAFDGFAARERTRLEEMRAAALEDRLAADLALGRHAAVTAEIEDTLVEQPYRERLWAHLILALYRCGRQAEALRAYQAVRTLLAEELGIAPGPALADLEARVLRHDPELAWQPAATPAARPHPRAGDEAAAGHGTSEDSDRPSHARLLVGRDGPLAAAHAALARASSGHGSLLLVAGEAGIGKTSLAEAVQDIVVEAGGIVAWGRCYERDGAPPFWPWIQVLRGVAEAADEAALEAVPASARADVSLLVPELVAALPAAAAPTDTGTARFQLFDSVAIFLRLAATRPTLLVLDDVHWADGSSLRLLQFVAGHLRDTRLLVLAAYRDDELRAGQPLAEVLGAVSREPTTERVQLGGLGREDVARYIALTTGSDISDATVDAVLARTDGNPFFVAELVGLLASEGGLAQPPTRADVPAGVRDVIRRRLARLPDDGRAALDAAAVQGRDFSLDVLSDVADLEPDRLLDLLEPALLTGVLEEGSAPGRYRFSHALVREALYEELSPVRRARLHGRVGTALRTLRSADLEPHVAELAHHFAMAAPAGFADDAVEYTCRTAGQAAARLAFDEAAAHWATAARLLDLSRGAAPEHTRVGVLLGLATARFSAGELDASYDALDEAVALARRLDAPELLRPADVGPRGAVLWPWRDRGTFARHAVDVLERAYSNLPPTESRLRAQALATLALEMASAPDETRAKELAAEAVSCARDPGEPAVVAQALNARLVVCSGPDDLDTRGALADELSAFPRSEEFHLLGRLHRLVCAFEHGVLDCAELDACDRLAAELRAPAFLAQITWMRAGQALLVGDLDGARRLGAEATARHHEASVSGFAESRLAFSVGLAIESGTPADLSPPLAFGPEIGPLLPAARALASCAAGERDAARAALAGGAALAGPRDALWLAGVTVTAEAVAQLGDADLAEAVEVALAPYRDRVAVAGLSGVAFGAVAHALGRLAEVAGRDDDAAAHFGAAGEVHERLGATAWAARSARCRAKALDRAASAPPACETRPQR